MRAAARVAFVASATIASAGAQTSPTAGAIHLRSTALGEERTVDVTLPSGYAGSTERYPVIVVLDGEANASITADVARYYASTGMMPKTIVVGVRNSHRTRDMTPAAVSGFAVPDIARDNGGADKFLAFLGDELIPHLDRTYRTAPMRVLVGHSLGGLFGLYALTKRPDLFLGYALLEPSVWWNDQREWNDAIAMLRDPRGRRARVMYVNAPNTPLDTTRFGGDAPMVRTILVAGETHESVPVLGIPLALRTMFSDFRPSPWKPGKKPIAMLERFDSLSARVGYPVPISANAYDQVALMSIMARQFDDAERVLQRREKAFGASPDLRQTLQEERATPPPAGLIPLVIPPTRPTPSAAAKFLGTWEAVGAPMPHRVTIRASGDTIIVHDFFNFPDGSLDEGDHQVIQVTGQGVLEWGLPWFRGIAALLVEKATIEPDGTMKATREPRGWVPRGPGGDMHLVEVFRRVDK